MGSFNDLMLHPINGHSVKENDISQMNKKLSIQRNKIYDLAVALNKS